MCSLSLYLIKVFSRSCISNMATSTDPSVPVKGESKISYQSKNHSSTPAMRAEYHRIERENKEAMSRLDPMIFIERRLQERKKLIEEKKKANSILLEEDMSSSGDSKEKPPRHRRHRGC